MNNIHAGDFNKPPRKLTLAGFSPAPNPAFTLGLKSFVFKQSYHFILIIQSVYWKSKVGGVSGAKKKINRRGYVATTNPIH